MIDEINEMVGGLKKMRWNMSDEVDDVTSPSLSLTSLQVGQK